VLYKALFDQAGNDRALAHTIWKVSSRRKPRSRSARRISGVICPIAVIGRQLDRRRTVSHHHDPDRIPSRHVEDDSFPSF